MTIYADVLFMMNFLFNAELLFLLCKIYSKKASLFKILLSAAVGGLCGVLVFVPNFEVLTYPPAKIALSTVMTAFVFLPCNRKTFIGTALAFYGVSFLISGAINFFGLKGIYGLFIPIPLYAIIRILKKSVVKKRSNTVLCYKGKTLSTEGFYDSGNMLESFGSPVILGSKNVFEKLFGYGFCISAISEWVEPSDMRIVPYSSFGKTGAALGVKLDYAKVCRRKYHDAVLVYTENKLSEDLILNSVMI